MDKLATTVPPTLADTDAGLPCGVAGAPPIEQAIGIFDLRGFSPMQADMELASFIVRAIRVYYPRRFARILFVDAPEIFSGFWDSLRPLLRHYAILVEFISAKDVCEQ